MNILKNEPLSRHTTLRVGGPAQFFVEAKTEEEIREAVKFAKKSKLPIFVLGGGSNVLVSDTGFAGLVIKVVTKGIHRSAENESTLIAEAGETWDTLVEYSVQHGLFGLENMSLIPGTAGAAVIGNIGAYGAEVKDTCLGAEALDVRTGLVRHFTRNECQFAYRHSFFKTTEGRNFILLRASFALNPHGAPNLAYKDVQEYFNSGRAKRPAEPCSPALPDIRAAIIAIRQRKLPDLAQVGTAGSFFKNPIVPKSRYEILAKRYPGLPGHDEGNGLIKLPLGWILDKICGLKGVRQGPVGTHAGQALVLVNHGGTASDVEAFAYHIARVVQDKTGLAIEWEVEKVGNKQ